MQITGTVKKVLPIASGTTKKGATWAAQQYILETTDDKPVSILLETFGDDNIKSFSLTENETVTVDYEPEVNEYRERYFGKNRILSVKRDDKVF